MDLKDSDLDVKSNDKHPVKKGGRVGGADTEGALELRVLLPMDQSSGLAAPQGKADSILQTLELYS